MYEYLDERKIEVHLAHPAYVKPFAKKHVKTDKVDARVLAQLLRMGYLLGINSECKGSSSFFCTKSLPEDLSQAKSQKVN